MIVSKKILQFKQFTEVNFTLIDVDFELSEIMIGDAVHFTQTFDIK